VSLGLRDRRAEEPKIVIQEVKISVASPCKVKRLVRPAFIDAAAAIKANAAPSARVKR